MAKIRLAGIWSQPLSVSDFLRFIHAWRMLVDGGIPHARAFKVMAREGGSLRTRRLCVHLASHIEHGATLFEALSWERHAFPRHVPGLFHIAERSGMVHPLLEKLEDFYTQTRNVQIAVMKQCAYPLAVLFCILNGIPLLQYFLLASARSTDLELAAIARILFNGLAPFVTVWLIYMIARGFRPLRTALLFLLTLPGPWRPYSLPLRRMSLAWALHFCAVAGLTWPGAIQFVAARAADPLQQRKLRGVPEQLKAGMPFAAAMRLTGLFNAVQISTIAIGDETGTLDVAFRRVADQCRDTAFYRIRNTTVLLEAVLIILIALGYGPV